MDTEGLLSLIGQLKPSLIIGMLFAGDRMSCCDEAVVMKSSAGELLGWATLAPRGEERNGNPTIVGVYIVPSARGKGFALPLLRATLERGQARGFRKMKIEVFSERLARVIEKLSVEEKAYLDVIVMPPVIQIDFFSDLEEE